MDYGRPDRPGGPDSPGGPGSPGAPEGPDRADEPGRLGSDVETTARMGFDALILTGGRGRRLGGRDKAALPVAGTPMLQRVLAACTRARRVIVAGQGPVPGGVQQVQEDPPGGGPVAGIVAGLEVVTVPWTLVLAVDQPDAARAVPGLLAAANSETRADGDAERGASAEAPGTAAETDLFCHVDADGYPQWLLGLYRTASLRTAVQRVGTGHGVSVRSLTAGLRIGRVVDGGAHVGDVDTWDDHARWEQRLG